MAQKSKGDKVSQKAEAPKPTTHARVAQNIYQPPKQKAKPAEVSRPAQAVKQAKAREVSHPTQSAKPAKPAEVKSKPAKAQPRAEKQESKQSKAPKATEKATKSKAAEKAKPQEGLLQRGLSGAVKLYKQIQHAGEAKAHTGKATGAKAEQTKAGKTAQKAEVRGEQGRAKGDKSPVKQEKTATKSEKATVKSEKAPSKTEKSAAKPEKSEKAQVKAEKTEKAPAKSEKSEKAPAKKEKSSAKTEKSSPKSDAKEKQSQLKKEPESGFSLTNFAGRAIESGKRLLMPEKEPPHVNKVENADKLTPQQRKEKGVKDYVDPKTGDRYDYNSDGLLRQHETKNKQKTTYEYENGKPVNISKTQKILFWDASIGSAEAVKGKVDLKVDQDSGEARTSRHNVIQQRDEKTNKVKNVEVKQEMVFHPNGEKSDITSNLDGRRIQKDTLTADDKKVATTIYSYGTAKAGQSDVAARATQYNLEGRVSHNFDYEKSADIAKQKVAAREDIQHERTGPIETERHQTYDLRSGKEVLVNRTDKTVDYKQGQSKVHEQQFAKGKLAVEQTVTFDERSKPVNMQFKDHSAKVEFSAKFDANGNAKEVKGDYKNYTDDQKIAKEIANKESRRIMAQHDVTSIDTGEMLVYAERSQPREGQKPTGVVAWKTPGETELSQFVAQDGIVYDGKVAIGKINDRGQVSLNDGKSFNILEDKAYKAVFHGLGTDQHPLNLYSTDGMNGFMATKGGGDRILMVGGNLISADGKVIGHMNDKGQMEFAKGTNPPQVAGTDISSVKKGDYTFRGNEDGNERRFFLNSASNGQIFVQKTDKAGNILLGADGNPVAPIDCENRLGMVIDKKTGKQLYNFIAPDVAADRSLSGGYMVSMGDSPKAVELADMKGTSFSFTRLGDGKNSAPIVGIATGPMQIQADGTPVRGSGGIVNLKTEQEKEDAFFKERQGNLNARLKQEGTQREIGGIAGTAVLGDSTTGIMAADAYNEATGGEATTEADRTALMLARKHHDDQSMQISRIMTTGQIDNTTLFKLQTGNDRIRKSQLDQLERLQESIDNPEHKLEAVTAKLLDGTIKRPDLAHPGQLIEYDVRNNLVYKKGSERAVGQVNAQDGSMKLYDASGRVEVSKMNDTRLAGTVFHLEGFTDNGNKQSVDWLADGTGKIQSFAEMRKQAAEQKQYAQLLLGDPTKASEQAKAAFERTQHNENRFNKVLDDMRDNGVRDVTQNANGQIVPGVELRRIIEGPKRNIQAESITISERMPPKVVSSPKFSTQEDCSKASGPMRVGGELYYCKNGQIFKAAEDSAGQPQPTGKAIGTLEPGYVLQIGDRRMSMQNESQFLFQFTMDGDKSLHRVFGTGGPHIDASGRYVSGGIVDAKELLIGAADAHQTANQAIADYYYEKPQGNPIADVLGWGVNKALGDRESQMSYVNDTINSQTNAMKSQLDTMFSQGFKSDGLTNNGIDHGVNTVNNVMRDLNLSAADTEQLSADGRNMQRQSSEAVAMALMSAVPGGITFAAGRMGATSLLATSGVARVGVAFMAGGGISVATRQSQKVDAQTAFATGGLECATMMLGAEGGRVLEHLKDINKAVKAAKAGAPGALQLLDSPATLELAKSASGRALIELACKPNGAIKIESMYKLANAGVQTTGLTLASSIRESNYDMMGPGKLAEGTAYMLASELVAMSVHLPGPGVTFKSEVGKSFDRGMKTFTGDAINNFSNGLMTSRVQAHEVELENIARERHIPKDLITPEIFERYKNDARINAYMMQTAAESMAAGMFTTPLNHAMSEGSVLREAIKQRTLDPKAPGVPELPRGAARAPLDTMVSTHNSDNPLAPDLHIEMPSVKASDKKPADTSDIKLDVPWGVMNYKGNGDVEVAPHSGGSYTIDGKHGKVSNVHDANGKETKIVYDTNGGVSELHVKNKNHNETWVKQGEEWVVISDGDVFNLKTNIEVTPDGQIKHTSDRGTSTHNLDGSSHVIDPTGHERTSLPSLDESVRVNHVMKMIEHNVSDPVLAARIEANVHHLMERVITSGVDRQEIAKTLMHVSDLLADNPNAKMDKQTRQRLAEEALWLAANPTYLNQGNHPTCAIAATEVREYLEHPSDVVKAISDIATKGEYVCPDGTVLRPFTADGTFMFSPDTDAQTPYTILSPGSTVSMHDSPRLMASQIWQTLAITAHYSGHDRFNGTTTGVGNIGYHNEFVSDMRRNPPTALSTTDGPMMYGGDLIQAVHKLTGRTEDLALIHQDREAGPGAHTFATESEFASRLVEIAHNKKFPVVFTVDTKNPPWSNPNGEVHIITLLGVETNTDPRDPRNISDIMPAPGTIDRATGKPKVAQLRDLNIRIDNQWGKKEDWNRQVINAEDLFLACLDPATAATERAARPPRGENNDGSLPIESEHHPHSVEKLTSSFEPSEGEGSRDARLEAALAQQIAEQNRNRTTTNTDGVVDSLTKSPDEKTPAGTTNGDDTPIKQEPTKRPPTTDEVIADISKRLGDKNTSPEERIHLAKQLQDIYLDLQANPEKRTQSGDSDSPNFPRSSRPKESVLEQNPNIAPEPFLQKRGSEQTESRDLTAREYADGKYKEHPVLEIGRRALDALKRFVGFDRNSWYHDATIDSFTDHMMDVSKKFGKVELGMSSIEKQQIRDANKALLQQEVKAFMDEQGLPTPELIWDEANLERRHADALYKFGEGRLAMRSKFFDGPDSLHFGTALHELTHLVQDFKIIRLARIEAERRSFDKSKPVLIGEVAKHYEMLTGKKVDLTSPLHADWFIRSNTALTKSHADFISEKVTLSKYAYKNDVDIQEVRELNRSLGDKDKNSEANRKILDARIDDLTRLLTPADYMFDGKQNFIASVLNGDSLYRKPLGADPHSLLDNLASTDESGAKLRRKLFGYDPLDSRYSERNATGNKQEIPSLDSRFMEMLTTPELRAKHPEFLRLVLNESRGAWFKLMQKEFPDLGPAPTGVKALTRLELKACIAARDHFYQSETIEGSAKRVVKEGAEPFGNVTREYFDEALKNSLQSQLADHLRFTKDQTHRIYYANRYEVEPRVAADRIYQRITERERELREPGYADKVALIQNNADELSKAALFDQKVPGTLSEFGFEVKTAQAIREGKTVAVAFIDLNNFKDVNTKYSQNSGDEALRVWAREAADILERHNLDPRECLGHFGGDEYGILLKGVPQETADRIFLEMQMIKVCCTTDPVTETNTTAGVDRDCLFLTPKWSEGEPKNAVVVTATLGAVNHKPGQTAEGVLQTADKVMFKMKEQVKQLRNEGKDVRISPYSEAVKHVMDAPESEQLQLYRKLNMKGDKFSVNGKTVEQIREQFKNNVDVRMQFLHGLLNKHRHTKIWGKEVSKDTLAKFVEGNEHFTLVRLSIDNFKPVNDVFESHAKGNKTLTEVGKFLLKLEEKHKEDIAFLGSLGGTSPFFIVRDFDKAMKLMRECDSFYLGVNGENDDFRALTSHKDANKTKGEIPIGFSAAALEFAPQKSPLRGKAANDKAEELLTESNDILKEVELDHIKQERHTARQADLTPDSDKKPDIPPGGIERRQPRN